jgi:hypothetical protein
MYYNFLLNHRCACFPFEADGKKYQSVEAYFQSLKFHPNDKYMEEIRLAKTPLKAASLGKYVEREREGEKEEGEGERRRRGEKEEGEGEEDLSLFNVSFLSTFFPFRTEKLLL